MPAHRRLRTAIVGATGYTGMELVRLLCRHPAVELSAITSESRTGEYYSNLYPHFAKSVSNILVSQDQLADYDLDLIFLALPHKASMGFVRQHGIDRAPLIDLSADFRLQNIATWEDWYGTEHTCREHLADAVYGLPELYRPAISEARLVANPGCYPTSSILPLAPLIKAGLVSPRGIVIDAKSGVTGAGYKPKPSTHYPTVNEGFSAYGLKRHRHTPEMEEILTRHSGSNVTLQLTPHLLPVNRGILSTIYAAAVNGVTEERLKQVLHSAYDKEPFIRLVDHPPSLDNVRGSNFCDICVALDERTGIVLVVSVIDNLVKGAAGQAVQNMNIMFGIEETTGLGAIPLSP